MNIRALTAILPALAFLAILSAIPRASSVNTSLREVDRLKSPNRQSQIIAQQPQSDIFGLFNHHSDKTTAINSQNINQMRFAWQINTEDFVSHTPLVNKNRVYFADWGGNVYAANTRTSKILWKKKVEQPNKQWPWYGFAGTGALGQGMLFEASVEGNAFGIDTDTGKVMWKTKFAEDPQAGSISQLLYYDGLVYIGLSSVEEPLSEQKEGFQPNFQGKVVALDAKTGKMVWQRQLVEAPQNGVSVWSSFALDPEMNALFFTTGNNYTGEPSELSDAMVAVNAKTGRIIWASQTLEHDVWLPVKPEGPDYDFGAGAQLFEATINGKRRKLVGAGQKSGFYWAFDRMTGKPVWVSNIGYGSKGGGIHAEASVGDGIIYVWSNNSYNYGEPPEKHPINIKAIDAATGAYRWVNPGVQPAGVTSAGFLTNDVYFVGSLDGQVRAYRASDGKKLWTSQTHPSVSSSLLVSGNTLFFAAGVPKPFGTRQGHGVFAYTIKK